ncbi:MAG: hypothetical protein L0Y36_09120 [Planctomycetales bacterium]|nr:hypothetical protein [Planctomycetales bacterium]
MSVHINRSVVRGVVAMVAWYPPITEEDKRAYAIGQNPQVRDFHGFYPGIAVAVYRLCREGAEGGYNELEMSMEEAIRL